MIREVISNEWFTVLFILCLSVLAIAKYSFANRFNEFLMVLGNSRYLKVYIREQKFIDLFDGFLFINLIISASIFAVICFQVYDPVFQFEIVWFTKLILGIGTIIVAKTLIERLIGSVFEIDELIDHYLFQKTNYKNFLGMVLLPINILLIYGVNPNKGIIISVLSLLLLINLIGFFTTVKDYQKLLLSNAFYFILYLCALEIGPYIILYKLLI